MEPSINPNLPEWIVDHLTRYLGSNGEDGHMWDSSIGGGEGLVPTLLLMTRGRKSGNVLTLPLIYGETDTGYVVIASKGGDPAHPAWYLNLDADPNVTVQVKADLFEARARVAEGEERERLWKQMAGIYFPYDKYAELAGDRVIPVVVLERV